MIFPALWLYSDDETDDYDRKKGKKVKFAL